MRKFIPLFATAAIGLTTACHAQQGLPQLPPGATPPPGMPALPPGMKPPAGMPPMDFKMYARTPDYADLKYAGTSASQTLDIYVPKGEGPFPVVVYIHGGAFKFGDKREGGKGFSDDIEALNAKGIAVASIDYRMSGEATYPAAVTDSKLAVRWLKANAASHKLDGRVGVWGKSAGAYLALIVTTTGGNVAPGVSSDYGNLSSTDDRVSGVVAMYPPVDFSRLDETLTAAGCSAESASHGQADSPESLFMGATLTDIPEKVRAASPLAFLTKSAPPALIMAGSADCTVSPGQAKLMADAYTRVVGVDHVTFKIVPGAVHADPKFDQSDNLAQTVAFFATVFKKAE